MNEITLRSAAAAALLAAGCSCEDVNINIEADGEQVGTVTGPAPTGQEKRVQVGFGAYAPPCGVEGSFIEYATDQNLGDIASQPIQLPFPATLVSVTVVHAVGDALGVCGPSEREVLVSGLTATNVPDGPGLHERVAFSESDVEGAPEYTLPDVTPGYAVALSRDLTEPLHGNAGQWFHLGSVLSAPTVCGAACGSLLDGSLPPAGHAYCADGEAWSACLVMPSGDPDGFRLAYMGWVEVVPD